MQIQFKNQESESTRLAKSKSKLFWKEIKSQYKQSSKESHALNTIDMYTHFIELYSSESTEHDDQEATNYIFKYRKKSTHLQYVYRKYDRK